MKLGTSSAVFKNVSLVIGGGQACRLRGPDPPGSPLGAGPALIATKVAYCCIEVTFKQLGLHCSLLYHLSIIVVSLGNMLFSI